MIEINHPLFDAKVLPQGAQLIAFRPKGLQALLWHAPLTTYQEGTPFRGGVPLCWPWFGKTASPSHGFARIMMWDLEHRTDSVYGVTLVFTLQDTPQTRALWPHAFLAKVVMHLSRTAHISLQVDTSIQTTAALHTYVSVCNVNTALIEGLGEHYVDALQEGTMCTDVPPLRIQAHTDRIYTQAQPITTVHNAAYSVELAHENHSDVVVWNPHEQAVGNFSDIEDFAYFVCVETARIHTPLCLKDTLGVTLGIKTS